MIFSIASASLVGLSWLSVVSAAPFSFPLPNGFPNIGNPSAQLTTIEQDAHGSLPNGKPPPNITEDSKTSLRLIAFNEISEVAFFTELIANITGNVDGFSIDDKIPRQIVLDALNAVVAQEELHALNANGALKNFGEDPIQPCKYNFAVSNFNDAIALATTFTDVVLGVLPDIQTLFGTDGDAGLIRGVGSVIGQEGEQNGFYRTILNKIPSALPFLTASTREFAFSALNQNFVVPGSCPNINEIDLPIFGVLTVETQNIQPKSQNIKFSFDISKYGGSYGNDYGKKSEDNYPDAGNSSNETQYSNLSLVYINQQNVPLVEELQNVQTDDKTVTFEAQFPFDEATFGNGLTIAAVTNSSGPFANADDVAKVTLFGPGLIEIN